MHNADSTRFTGALLLSSSPISNADPAINAIPSAHKQCRSSSIGALAFISGGLNIALAKNYGYLYMKNIINLGDNILFDNKTILLMLWIVIFYFLFATLVSLLVLRRKTPLDVIKDIQD